MNTLLIDLYEEHDVEKNVYSCMMTDASHILFLSLESVPHFDRLQIEEFIERHVPVVEEVSFQVIGFQEVEAIVAQQAGAYERILVDTHGGDALLAVALYRAAVKHGCEVMSLDVVKSQLHHWKEDGVEIRECLIPTLTLEQVISLRGGEIIRAKQPIYTAAQQEALIKIARFALSSPKKWLQISHYFSALKVNPDLRVLAPKSVRHPNGRSYSYPAKQIQWFKDAGLMKIYQELHHSVDLGFTNRDARHFLSTKGFVLEVYLYLLARASGFFDEVLMGVEIDWNGVVEELDNVQNEIDLVLRKGRKTVFVSCKMTEATPAAINELELYAEHFLGDDCIKVFVCTGGVSPAYANRCREYGILLIDQREVADFVNLLRETMG